MGTRKKVNKKITRVRYLQKEAQEQERMKRKRLVKIKKPVDELEVLEKQEAMRQAVRFQERTDRYVKAGLHTVGVRFAVEPGRIYTYLVPAHRNLYLGMELIVENKYGNSTCCYLVRIDNDVKLPDPAVYDDELKRVTGKVVEL